MVTPTRIDTQRPDPNSLDSMYEQNIDIDNSDIGNFSGDVTDLFDSLKSVITDSTANNPKTLKIAFTRSVQLNSIGFGCDDMTKSFSNIVVKLLGSGEEIRFTQNEFQNDNTKRNSQLIRLPPSAANGVIIEFHTTDEICLSNVVIFKALDVNSRIQAVSTLTDKVETITSYRGGLDINNAWLHRKIVNETYHQFTGVETTPSIAITEGDTSITVDDATGFIIGSELMIVEGPIQEIGILTVTNVVANVITIDRPIGNPYTTSAEIKEVTTNMAVSGSLASPEIFEIQAPITNIWQITRILFSIVDNITPDDGRFGGIVALTNGVSLRATTAAGRTVVFANWKTNGDMKLDMFDVTYTDRAPSGQFGVNGRWTFTSAEVIAELDGDSSPIQKLEMLIQDDLTGLIDFRMRAQGRVDRP